MPIIEANSPELTELIDEAAPVEQLCTGFQFVEGPIWNPKEQCLYFSDIPANIRYRWSPDTGATEARNPSNRGNGMTYDGAGNLYICEHNTSMLIRETPSGERTIVASHWQGKELNSPNDVVVRSDYSVYFSDPSYGRLAAVGIERQQDLAFQGLFRVSPDGELHLEADDFGQTNGLCFSPDEKLLYVDDSPRAHIRVFDVASDGSLSNSRIFAENIGDGELWHGIVDGMKCDERGNIYVTGFSQNTSGNLGYATIKYAPNGNQVWSARYDTTNTRSAKPAGLSLDKSNNVVITGSALTVKYDRNGNQLWTAPYAGTALAADTNANVIVTGFGTNFNTVKLLR